jgi:hypothetical protein
LNPTKDKAVNRGCNLLLIFECFPRSACCQRLKIIYGVNKGWKRLSLSEKHSDHGGGGVLSVVLVLLVLVYYVLRSFESEKSDHGSDSNAKRKYLVLEYSSTYWGMYNTPLKSEE